LSEKKARTKGNHLTNAYYREVLNKNTTLKLSFEDYGSGSSIIDVIAVLNSIKSNGKKKIGKGSIRIDSKKRAQLLDIFVKFPYRHKGIGSRMLKLMVDYIQDGIAKEIWGNISDADDLDEAIKFYTKNGFSISKNKLPQVEQTIINLTLTKPLSPQFLHLPKVHQITKEEYEKF